MVKNPVVSPFTFCFTADSPPTLLNSSVLYILLGDLLFVFDSYTPVASSHTELSMPFFLFRPLLNCYSTC
jgi:hypothetical protein